MGLRLSLAALGVAAGFAVFGVRDAEACGGCFHPPPQPAQEITPSVITDHRMVFKVSANETILWDQVRYTGSPDEFAWVLPIRTGATIQLARDEFIASLDAATPTAVNAPIRQCGFGGGNGASFNEGDDEGNSSGCKTCGDSADSLAFSDDAPRASGNAVDGGAAPPAVSVVSQQVIGPYEAVTLHANFGQGISDWLTQNNFAIPDNVKPIVDAYTKEGFDFIALKLKPGAGVQAMRPVRVSSPGSDVSLPLRMVAAGVGANVGMTLWVIGEGRYGPASFPGGVVNDADLKWDGKAARSNLTDLEGAILAQNDGRTWLTEQATQQWAAVAQFYLGQCIANPPHEVPCDADQLPQTTSVADAGADAGSGAPVDAGTCTKVVSACEGFDDIVRATDGLDLSQIWITRLRAYLPAAALSTDLTLAAGDQTPINGTHQSTVYTDVADDPCPPATTTTKSLAVKTMSVTARSPWSMKNKSGTLALIALTAFVMKRLRGKSGKKRAYSGRK